MALACSLLIFLHVKDELSFEQGFPKADQIYRITIESSRGDTYQHWAASPPPLGIMAQEQIPEIKQVARFTRITDAVLRT